MKLNNLKLLLIGVALLFGALGWYWFSDLNSRCGIVRTTDWGFKSDFATHKLSTGDCTCLGIKSKSENPDYSNEETDTRCFGIAMNPHSETHAIDIHVDGEVTITAPGMVEQTAKDPYNHYFVLPLPYHISQGKKDFQFGPTIHVSVKTSNQEPWESDVPLDVTPTVHVQQLFVDLSEIPMRCADWSEQPILARAKEWEPSRQLTSFTSYHYHFLFLYPKCWKEKSFIGSEYLEDLTLSPSQDCPENEKITWKIEYKGQPYSSIEAYQFKIDALINSRPVTFYEKIGASLGKPFSREWIASLKCNGIDIEPSYKDSLSGECLEKEKKVHFIPDIFLKFISNIRCG